MKRKLLVFVGFFLVACLPNAGCAFFQPFDNDLDARTNDMLKQSGHAPMDHPMQSQGTLEKYVGP